MVNIDISALMSFVFTRLEVFQLLSFVKSCRVGSVSVVLFSIYRKLCVRFLWDRTWINIKADRGSWFPWYNIDISALMDAFPVHGSRSPRRVSRGGPDVLGGEGLPTSIYFRSSPPPPRISRRCVCLVNAVPDAGGSPGACRCRLKPRDAPAASLASRTVPTSSWSLLRDSFDSSASSARFRSTGGFLRSAPPPARGPRHKEDIYPCLWIVVPQGSTRPRTHPPASRFLIASSLVSESWGTPANEASLRGSLRGAPADSGGEFESRFDADPTRMGRGSAGLTQSEPIVVVLLCRPRVGGWGVS